VLESSLCASVVPSDLWLEPVRSCDGEDPVMFFFKLMLRSLSVRIRNDRIIPSHADILLGGAGVWLGRCFLPYQVGSPAKFVWLMLRNTHLK